MAVIIVDCPVFFNTAKESKVMNKMHECFCGKIFNDGQSFNWHAKYCQIYQDYKNQYLTYDNFYNLYMIQRLPWCKIVSSDPYLKFREIDILRLQKECNFPKLYKVASGEMLTQSEIDSILSKEVLYNMYVLKKMSITDIFYHFNKRFHCEIIRMRMKKYGISTRNKVEAMACCSGLKDKIKVAMNRPEVKKKLQDKANLPEVREKYKKTCIQRYGSDNVSKSETIKLKKQRTCEKNFGVKNPFQSEKVREKHKRNLIRKYGIINPVSLHRNNSNPLPYSKIAIDLFDKITAKFDFNISKLFRYATHNNELSVVSDNYCTYFIDFSYCFNNLKLAIEFNGDYWHCNPTMYESTDKATFMGENKIAKDVWEKDKNKIECLQKLGFKILVIWESDYHNNPNETIEKCYNFIKSHIEEQTNKEEDDI